MCRTTALLLALCLVPFAGCRDVLVDSGGGIPQAPTGPGSAPSLYLKGPTSLRVTSQANYRAEYIAGVDHYEWRAIGAGTVQISFPYGDSRLPVVTGATAGTVDLIAEAYDVGGAVIGLAAKTIEIQ